MLFGASYHLLLQIMNPLFRLNIDIPILECLILAVLTSVCLYLVCADIYLCLAIKLKRKNITNFVN